MKSRMRGLTLAGLSLIFGALQSAAEPANGGWVPLFDGVSLDGWFQKGGAARYRVENGVIVGETVPNTSNSFLCTRRQFGDFELELQFNVASNLNSGVQIRSHVFEYATNIVTPTRTVVVPAHRVHGLQVEIDPSPRAWTGGIFEESARGWLFDLKDRPAARAAFKPGEWNQLRVICRGPSIETWLNGVPAAKLNDDRQLSGFIALQVHKVGTNNIPRQVRFRNLRLRPLD